VGVAVGPDAAGPQALSSRAMIRSSVKRLDIWEVDLVRNS